MSRGESAGSRWRSPARAVLLRGLLIAALFASRAALAGKPAAKSDTAAKSNAAPSSGADASDVDKAREHLRKAGVHYDLQEFRKALTEFREAYRLKNDPVILFDMGQCNRKMAKYKEAIGFYKSYLRKVPSANNRPEAERLIAESEELLKESPPEAAAPAPVPAEAAPAPPPISPPPAEGGLGNETMPLGQSGHRRRRGRFRPDAGASAGSGSDSGETSAGK